MQTLDKEQLLLLSMIEGGQTWFAAAGGDPTRPVTEAEVRQFQATVSQLRVIRDAGYIELIEHEVNRNGQTLVDRVEVVPKF